MTDKEIQLLHGKGIDIGCGKDPVTEECQKFDVEDGDANEITKYVQSTEYDYVFSSHCLEHMKDPKLTLKDWWKLIRNGGTMIIIVPDEDLYEQGYWPSIQRERL